MIVRASQLTRELAGQGVSTGQGAQEAFNAEHWRISFQGTLFFVGGGSEKFDFW